MSTPTKKEYDRLRYQRLKDHKNAQSKKWRNEHLKKSHEIEKKSRDKYRFGGLREVVLKRDKQKCVICGRKIRVIVHHKDETENRKRKNANNTMENLITLCRRCHRLFHWGKLKI